MALKYSFSLFLSIFEIISHAFLSSSLLLPSILPSSGIEGAYWPSWLAESYPPSTIPIPYFTHLFFAFVVPDATTYQLSITQPDEWMANFTATLHSKNPPEKAFLSIRGANASPYTLSSMVSSTDNRTAFINSTIAIARKYGFDGCDLDCDWESPDNPQDMSNLPTFFIEWRSGVNRESVARSI